MNDNETKKSNRTNVSFIREALANDEIRATVRERLLAEGKLPHYTRERMTEIVKAFLAEEKAKEEGIQEITPSP